MKLKNFIKTLTKLYNSETLSVKFYWQPYYFTYEIHKNIASAARSGRPLYSSKEFKSPIKSCTREKIMEDITTNLNKLTDAPTII